MINTSRTIRPDDFELFAQILGIVCVARNEELRLIWCTPSFCQIAEKVISVDDVIGTTIEDILPEIAANERIRAHQKVMETNLVMHYYRLINDTRMLCTILPLDEKAFGHRGTFVIVQDAPNNLKLKPEREIPVLSISMLGQLRSLTKRELEVLHFVASGKSTQEISKCISRAEKTVEHHINAIHRKLETHSRAQLVRFASERGIHSFSDLEWESIVKGAWLVRQDSAPISETEAKPAAKSSIEANK